MLLAYAGFVSVVMVSECEGSFGGPITSYFGWDLSLGVAFDLGGP